MQAEVPAATPAPEPAAPGREAEEAAVSLYWPQPVEVRTEPDGVPNAVESVPVDAVREEWLIEDRWWTPKPLRRRYFELVLADGRNVVVFREPSEDGRWFLQRA